MFASTYALLWVVVLFQAFVIVVLARQMVQLRLHDSSQTQARNTLPLESEAPKFQARNLRTGEIFDSMALRGRRTVLCFLSAECHACRKVAGDFIGLTGPSLQGIVLYCNAAQDACRRLLSAVPEDVLLLMSKGDDVPALFQLSGFPTAVVLDENGRILAFRTASGVADLIAELQPVHVHQHERKLEIA